MRGSLWISEETRPWIARSCGMSPPPKEPPLTTPDGRYIVVRGRLWRRTDPALPNDERELQVEALMAARRAVATAKRLGDPQALGKAREQVDAAKRALGERGPVWWSDGAPDYTRRLAKNTPYAEWFSSARGAARP